MHEKRSFFIFHIYDIFCLIKLLHYYNFLLVIYFYVKVQYWEDRNTFENNLIFM